MTPELHQRAGELFDRVRDMPASECAAAIQSACNGNLYFVVLVVFVFFGLC